MLGKLNNGGRIDNEIEKQTEHSGRLYGDKARDLINIIINLFESRLN